MDSSVQRVADMDWDLVMHYVAGGARWRRVPETQRPSIEVRVEFFEPQISHWTELERVSFWADAERDSIFSEAGALSVRYKPGAGEKDLGSFLKDHIWRVAKRDGRLFTVELAAFHCRAGGFSLSSWRRLRTGATRSRNSQESR